MIYYQRGSASDVLDAAALQEGLFTALGRAGVKRRVLLIPPDFTRFHSRAGELTVYAWQYYGDAVEAILPALGTHRAMTAAEIATMFPGVPASLFHIHDWRHGTAELGRLTPDYIAAVSAGAVRYDWPAQITSLIPEAGYDLILSIGQIVPHEVAGMAGYTKNLFVGTGGAEGINKSHFLGAAHGMERLMGRLDNPVRQLFTHAAEQWLRDYPILYVQTVIARDTNGELVTRGLFIGDDIECYRLAGELSLQVNFSMLERPLSRVVVWLDPAEYRSTWLGNKSIYRTRMAIADGGELIILAPGLREFGEDPRIDRLIRRHGYAGTPAVLDLLNHDPELVDNLSAAAHLIHGSSEGRFTVTYCPGKLTREEVQGVHYGYGDLEQMQKRYNPERMREGVNRTPDGEELFFIHNPAIGLWAARERFISNHEGLTQATAEK